MNSPKATMHDVPTHSTFLVLDMAVEAAGIAIRLAKRVPAPLKPIADQVIRSASFDQVRAMTWRLLHPEV